MSGLENSLRDELIQRIENSWNELEACLGKLSVAQMTELQDAQGWSVKDHLSHLAAWDRALLELFDGTPRYQTLGIDLAIAREESMDAINDLIRVRWEPVPVQSVIAEYREIHNRLLAKLGDLTDADLNRPVSEYFPHEVPDYNGRVIDIFQNNPVNHVVEHLDWIKVLIGQG